MVSTAHTQTKKIYIYGIPSVMVYRDQESCDYNVITSALIRELPVPCQEIRKGISGDLKIRTATYS